VLLLILDRLGSGGRRCDRRAAVRAEVIARLDRRSATAAWHARRGDDFGVDDGRLVDEDYVGRVISH
jgi:hypothetical protein